MFKRKKIITVVELGASKAVVVIANCSSDDDKFSVLGYSVNDTNQAIIKGEIVDSNKAFEILEKTLKEASRDAEVAIDPRYIFFNITACDITSEKSSGHILIRGDQGIITQKDVNEATLVARESNSKMYSTRYSLQAFSNYFMIDDTKRVIDPIGEIGCKLTATVCNILANTNKLEPFLKLFGDLDYGTDVSFVFSGISSSWGVLPESSEDRENGVLVIDVGAGTTEYTVFYKKAVVLAKVLPVGVHHIINDVKIAFDLSFKMAQEIVCNGKYLEMRQSGEVYYDVQTSEQKMKRLQLEELEKVINLRIHETLGIIHNELLRSKIKDILDNGLILTGGGALIKAVELKASDIFDLPQRIGRPLNSVNVPKDLYYPQFSSSLGLLNLICTNQANFLEKERYNILLRSLYAIDNTAKNVAENIKDKFKAFKL